MFDALRQDVRFAARALLKRPGFTVAAVTMMALGIGVNAAVFTVANATLFKGFPLVRGNDRLLYIGSNTACCVSYPDYEDWKAQATSLEGMALVHGLGVTLSDRHGFPETHTVTQVTANTFSLVGQQPILGRDFTASDEVPGAPPVAILRYSFWDRRYGKDEGVIGRTVRLDGVPTTVVGVMPPGFSFPQNQDVWAPLVPTPEIRRRDNRDTWFVVARIADGATLEGARAEMATIGQRLARTYPATNTNSRPEVHTFNSFFIGSTATTIYQALWAAVGLVLLIAGANLANLLLARALGRTREMSIRVALGAGRWRIVRQLLVESVLLSGLGGALGWWLATWAVPIYAALGGPAISDQIVGDWFDHVLDYSADGRVTAYIAALSVGTGLLFGLAPALKFSRLNVNASLKDGGRGAMGPGRFRHLSAALIAGEVALAVVLLVGAGLMIRSFVNVYTANLGFKTEDLLVAFTSLPSARYPDADAQTRFYDRLVTRLNAVPGVEAVALANDLPGLNSARLPYELADAPPVDEPSRPRAASISISPSYFRTLGVGLLSGRAFTDADGPSAPRVVIVSRGLATTAWPGESPLGKRVRLLPRQGQGPGEWMTVVGVVQDIAHSRASNTGTNAATGPVFEPALYRSFRQGPAPFMWTVARTGVPSSSLVTTVRREVQTLDPDLPVSLGPVPLRERLAPIHRYRGFTAAMFFFLAAIALLLASTGLYSIVAHAVGQRTEEIGVRLAMGATAGDVLALVLGQGLRPVGLGLLVGLAISFGVSGLLRSQLVGVSPSDPLTLLLACGALALAGALGCWFPARRAARIDPIVALRQE